MPASCALRGCTFDRVRLSSGLGSLPSPHPPYPTRDSSRQTHSLAQLLHAGAQRSGANADSSPDAGRGAGEPGEGCARLDKPQLAPLDLDRNAHLSAPARAPRTSHLAPHPSPLAPNPSPHVRLSRPSPHLLPSRSRHRIELRTGLRTPLDRSAHTARYARKHEEPIRKHEEPDTKIRRAQYEYTKSPQEYEEPDTNCQDVPGSQSRAALGRRGSGCA